MNLERERKRETTVTASANSIQLSTCTNGGGDIDFCVSESGVLHDLRVECRVLFPVVLCHAGRSAR